MYEPQQPAVDPYAYQSKELVIAIYLSDGEDEKKNTMRDLRRIQRAQKEKNRAMETRYYVLPEKYPSKILSNHQMNDVLKIHRDSGVDEKNTQLIVLFSHVGTKQPRLTPKRHHTSSDLADMVNDLADSGFRPNINIDACVFAMDLGDGINHYEQFLEETAEKARLGQKNASYVRAEKTTKEGKRAFNFGGAHKGFRTKDDPSVQQSDIDGYKDRRIFNGFYWEKVPHALYSSKPRRVEGADERAATDYPQESVSASGPQPYSQFDDPSHSEGQQPTSGTYLSQNVSGTYSSYQPQNVSTEPWDPGNIYDAEDENHPAPGPSTAVASPTEYRVPDPSQFDTTLGVVTSQMSNLGFGGSSGQTGYTQEAGSSGTQQPYRTSYASQYGDQGSQSQYMQDPMPSSALQPSERKSKDYSVYSDGGTRREAHINRYGDTKYKDEKEQSKASKAFNALKNMVRKGPKKRDRDGRGGDSKGASRHHVR
jgi:hypothetical protein